LVECLESKTEIYWEFYSVSWMAIRTALELWNLLALESYSVSKTVTRTMLEIYLVSKTEIHLDYDWVDL